MRHNILARFIYLTMLCLSCAYVGLCAAAFYYGDLALRTSVVIVGTLIFFMMLANRGRRLGQPFVCTILVFLCIFGFSWLNSEETSFRSVFTVFILLGCFGVAWFTLDYEKTAVFFEYPFYLMLAFSLYLIVVEGYGPSQFNNLLEGSSRNVYSGALIALASGYIYSRVLTGKVIALWPLFLVVVISIPLYSRNGLVISVLLFSFVLIKRSPIAAAVCAFLSMVAVALFWSQIMDAVMVDTNLGAGLTSDRFKIAGDFLAHLNFLNVLKGTDLSQVDAVVDFGGNPHNAYIRLQSFYGAALLPFLVVVFVSLIQLLVDKKYLLAFVLFLYLFRAYFDIFYLFNLFDFLVFPLVFHWYFRRYLNQSRNSGDALLRS
ncbi:hypothetical protein [Pseudomonas sp. efr-133-TYG-103a]|uniref:hypothetical protein n=1 Tax=Pseudomonas sp. efr-133-TYG-103a TaxID=3040308 RepID=UPI002556DFC4|nr:hypothetical protein [Pseudomonas sp. efr-133-TYG-103a]